MFYHWALISYQNFPKFSIWQAWANNVDTDYTASIGSVLSESSLFAFLDEPFYLYSIIEAQN